LRRCVGADVHAVPVVADEGLDDLEAGACLGGDGFCPPLEVDDDAVVLGFAA
jgi:hypothetical protein